MTITKAKPRRDGKYTVHLSYSNGVILRKVMTREMLAKFSAAQSNPQERVNGYGIENESIEA